MEEWVGRCPDRACTAVLIAGRGIVESKPPDGPEWPQLVAPPFPRSLREGGSPRNAGGMPMALGQPFDARFAHEADRRVRPYTDAYTPESVRTRHAKIV